MHRGQPFPLLLDPKQSVSYVYVHIRYCASMCRCVRVCICTVYGYVCGGHTPEYVFVCHSNYIIIYSLCSGKEADVCRPFQWVQGVHRVCPPSEREMLRQRMQTCELFVFFSTRLCVSPLFC